MRIKDLATRATKLLTGNAYMVFDNGTKVEKVDYAELAKQIITEYNTQTLAGSAQSVKSALDALNSKSVDVISADTETVTIAANSQGSLVASFTLPQGGTALGVVGLNARKSALLSIVDFKVGNATATVWASNRTSAPIEQQYTIYVLYKKS